MTNSEVPPSQSTGISTNPDDAGNANLIYILYLLVFAGGITGIIGVVMAYLAKDTKSDWLRSHYINQINIFWKGLLYMTVSVILCVVLIGFVLIFVSTLWYIIRVVKGMQTLTRGEAITDPGRWGF